MGKYQVDSDFDDLHDDGEDEELDQSNPIIKAAFQDDEDWESREKDDTDEDDSEDDADDDETEDEEEDQESDSDESKDDDQDTEDDDDSSYSKKVQQRIDRERNLRLKTERDANRRILKLENREKLRDAKDDFRTKQSEAEQALKGLRKKKRDAKEAGDSDEEIEVDEKILDIKSELRVSESEFKKLEKDLTAEPADEDDTSGLPEPARKWLDKYPQFYTNNKFGRAVRLADQMVNLRGLDKNTDGYYAEIEKILAPQFPEIVKPAKQSTKGDKRKESARKELKRRRGAVGGTTKAGTRRPEGKTRKGQKRITAGDKAMMLNFGLDPANPEHCKEWALNRTD
jgi:hypothetical protein